MERRTKIVATVGPASEDPATLRAMIAAGMDMARLSLAHGPPSDTVERIARVRQAAADEGRTVGVLVDLPGPKVRAAAFPEGGVHLAEGNTVELVPAVDDDAASDGQRIVVDDPDVVDHLGPGDTIALGDGGIQLLVTVVGGGKVAARVLSGGPARGRPGVSYPGGTAMATPTAEDLRLLEIVCAADIDAVAVSFVRSAADIRRVREAVGPGGPMLIAKIETQEAVDAIEDVISASDGVMVARGDLGVRCALEDVPHYQKLIIRTGVAYARPVITATQMLESMVSAPTPTRAEVSDVANAVFDGSSALMLSGETAIGHDPAAAVRAMARIAARAEREFNYELWGRNLGLQLLSGAHGGPVLDRIGASISAAAWRAAIDADAAAIIACTNSGATARAISRFRPRMPILAATPSLRTARQLSVAWGITPVVTERRDSTDDIVWFAIMAAVDMGMVKSDDIVAILVGSRQDPDSVTDVLRLVRIR
ncbi:MAG: pyruvate kinase [Actinomycetota bacterium]|nr:pyruvate kinase [Actinomycetota bacterium]